MKRLSERAKMTTRTIAYGAASTALVAVATMLGFSSAQFYFNLGDALILLVSAIFGPVIGMIAGGIGSFLADLAVYPATMFFTLAIKGLEGLLAGVLFSVIGKKIKGKKASWTLSFVAAVVSTAVMMTGYFICQTFFYGTYASALVALPMDAVQASVSAVLAFVLLFPLKLISFKDRLPKTLKRIPKDPKEEEQSPTEED